VCLVLAVAGLQAPSHAPRQVVVAAADVSDSIYDLATQTVRLNETLEALDRDTSETAVTVFAGLPASNGAWRRCPHGRRRASRPAALLVAAISGKHTVSGPRAPATVVDRSATDLGAAVSFAAANSRQTAPMPPRDSPADDFRDTCGSADAAVAALAGSGIDCWPFPRCSALPPMCASPRCAARDLPDGRDLPVEVTVSAQNPCTVRVAVWRSGLRRR